LAASLSSPDEMPEEPTRARSPYHQQPMVAFETIWLSWFVL
jgi:hypothetical protein